MTPSALSFVYQIGGVLLILLLFLSIPTLFLYSRKLRNDANTNIRVLDFIVGDDGNYSLSRFQMVLWALVIMAFQTSVIGIMWFEHHRLDLYNLIFSDEILWLLGLSFGSYISVKGIAITRINSGSLKMKRVENPEWSALIMGNNGLDFSKFQMLVWTLLAIIVYLVQCHHYFDLLLYEPSTLKADGLDKLTHSNLFAELFRSDSQAGKYKLYIPNIDMTFIVLMGLSQGTYIGKKLVPDFKVKEVLEKTIADKKYQLEVLQNEIDFLELQREQAADMTSINTQQAVEAMSKKIGELKRIKADLEKEIKGLEVAPAMEGNNQ